MIMLRLWPKTRYNQKLRLKFGAHGQPVFGAGHRFRPGCNEGVKEVVTSFGSDYSLYNGLLPQVKPEKSKSRTENTELIVPGGRTFSGVHPIQYALHKLSPKILLHFPLSFWSSPAKCSGLAGHPRLMSYSSFLSCVTILLLLPMPGTL